MKGRPLADDLAPGPGILELVLGDARQMIGGGVADAVAARLNGVHLHSGEFGENLGNLLELGPVELQVLPRREMSVSPVVAPRDRCEGAQLDGREQAIGNRDPEHGRVALDIQAIAQAQMPELILAQVAREKSAGLIAKLLHALADQRLVDDVVAVHGPYFIPRARPRLITAAHELMP